jgi:hypothetical protein
MHPGDKVRLLHSKEEGVVKRVLKNGLIEVEIEDGFVIPVTGREIVLVNAQEKRFFAEYPPAVSYDTDSRKAVKKPEMMSSTGIYAVFIPKNDRELSLHLINNTDYRLVFALFEKRKNEESGLIHGILEPKSFQKSESYFKEHFQNWPEWVLEVIYYTARVEDRPASWKKSFRPKSPAFFSTKSKAPLLNADGFVLQLDTTHIPAVPVKELQEALRGDRPRQEESLAIGVKPVGDVLDLHMEALMGAKVLVPEHECLKIQLNAFDKALNQALAAGQDEITFIHGVGNGKLRHEIHKVLSGMSNLLTFRDAQKEKFGYGATKVTFKNR